jgi:hypothetical protein
VKRWKTQWFGLETFCFEFLAQKKYSTPEFQSISFLQTFWVLPIDFFEAGEAPPRKSLFQPVFLGYRLPVTTYIGHGTTLRN